MFSKSAARPARERGLAALLLSLARKSQLKPVICINEAPKPAMLCSAFIHQGHPMKFVLTPVAIAAFAASLALALPASAESITSAGSSASSAGSASLKGSSDSITGSSDSSSTDKTALVHDGDYRVAAVAPADKPDSVRLMLEPLDMANAQPFALTVPTQAFKGELPVAGDRIHAQRRAYGVQFARAQEPFFLVLADAWTDDLASRPITN